MRTAKIAVSIRWVLLPVILMVLTIGCHSRHIPFLGLPIPAKSQLGLIEGGNHNGTWHSDDLVIDYRYTRTPSHLKISGSIDFADGIKNSYTQLDHFFLWLHLIDREDKIVGYRRIDQQVSPYRIEKAPFHSEIEISPQIKAVVFSYSGRAIAADEDSTMIMNFWRLPDSE